MPAATRTWNGGTSGEWSNPANWTGGLPANGDDVKITDSGQAVILRSSSPSLASLTLGTNTLTVTNWTTVIYATNMTIQNGGKVTLPLAFKTTQMSNRVYIACSNFTINAGGQIDVDYKGYYPWYGPGCPGNGGAYYWPGASHGGRGGKGADGNVWAKDPCGSASAPLWPGSGGGSYNDAGRQAGSGRGGGAVRIQASGTVTVDGTISSRGGPTATDNLSAGGAGGSVYITCNTFGGAATGLIRVDGGNSTVAALSGGGAGGRIAVSYQSVSATHATRFSAAPASQCWFYGDVTNRWQSMPMPGTLWLPDTQLLSTTLDNTLLAGAVNIVGITNWTPATLLVSNCWVSFGQNRMVLKTTGNIQVKSGGSLGACRNT